MAGAPPHGHVPAVEVHGVAKRFGRLQVLDGAQLALPAGETLALFGRNGAGKTTLLRIIATLSAPSSGSVRIQGLDARRNGPAVRARLGFLSHQTYLYDDLTAEENLRYYARLYGIASPKDRINQLLADVGLTARKAARVRNFSRGMQQRLGLARALLHSPSLLLLDEPFTGLDLEASEILMKNILAARSEGRTCILTTHSMEQGLACATRVAVLENGIIAHEGPVPPGGVEEMNRIYAQCRGRNAA